MKQFNLKKKNTIKVTYDGKEISFAEYKKIREKEREQQKRKKKFEEVLRNNKNLKVTRYQNSKETTAITKESKPINDPTIIPTPSILKHPISQLSVPTLRAKPVNQMYNFLLLDDEPVTLCFHEKLILRFSGKAIFYTATGNSEAERFLQWASPKIDIMISDINHRDGDGLAFIQKIHKAYPELKIFIVSGTNASSQRAIAHKFIADGTIKGYLSKLFEIPDFVAMLHDAGVE